MSHHVARADSTSAIPDDTAPSAMCSGALLEAFVDDVRGQAPIGGRHVVEAAGNGCLDPSRNTKRTTFRPSRFAT
jgi:hypothetical protein